MHFYYKNVFENGNRLVSASMYQHFVAFDIAFIKVVNSELFSVELLLGTPSERTDQRTFSLRLNVHVWECSRCPNWLKHYVKIYHGQVPSIQSRSISHEINTNFLMLQIAVIILAGLGKLWE